MKNHHRTRVKFALLSIMMTIVFLLTVQNLLATPPSTIQVSMYQLNADGSRYNPTVGVYHPCATTTQYKFGCTAFDSDQTLNPGGTPVTVVPYPYGETPAPEISFENDYLKNVVPQEIIASGPLTAVQAQGIAARTYAMFHVLRPTPTPNATINNSTSFQAFVPYRFEYLRAEGGDWAHNPITTPTADFENCSNFDSTGVTRYQRKVCDALNGSIEIGNSATPTMIALRGLYVSSSTDSDPINAQYRTDNGDPTNPSPCTTYTESYLVSVQDPISDGASRTQADCDSVGLSTNGALRWAFGNIDEYGGGTDWSLAWSHPSQILAHYYTGVDLRDSSETVLTPPLRWNILQHNIPTTLEVEDGVFFELQVQNTGTTAWDNLYYGIYTRWCELNDTSCPDYDTSNDWDINGAFISDNQEASQVEPGETIQTVYGYVVSDETGTRRLVIDACVYQGPMLAPRRPGESLQEWKERFKNWQERRRTEGTHVDWDCFGHQNPAWPPYEIEITTE